MASISLLEDFFLELKKQGISKSDVAERIGVSQSYISKILSGEKPVTASFTNALHKQYAQQLKKLGISLRRDMGSVVEAPDSYRTGNEDALDNSIKNLTESSQKIADAYLINQKNIERLIALMEAGHAERQSKHMELEAPGTPGVKTIRRKHKEKTGSENKAGLTNH